eukprot:TCONS_00049256-protein
MFVPTFKCFRRRRRTKMLTNFQTLVTLVAALCLVGNGQISKPDSGTDGGPSSLTIIDYVYRYIKPDDQCRSAIFYFWTPQPNNASTFKILLIISQSQLNFNLTSYIDSSCCHFNDSNIFPGNGYCSCSDLDLVHGYTIHLQLIQTMPGQSKTLISNTFTRRLNFIAQRTGNITDFTAHALDTSASVEVSWTFLWPYNARGCGTLFNLLMRSPYVFFEHCMDDDKNDELVCFDVEVPLRLARCKPIENKPRQRCSYTIGSLKLGTQYTFRMKYTFGIDLYSPFTNESITTTLNEVPTIAPLVNCTVIDGFPFLRWEKPNEKLIYPYNNYKLSWREGPVGQQGDLFDNSFSIGRSQYLLKKVQIDRLHQAEFYLNICTVKGCTNRQDPCQLARASLIQDGNETESEVDVTMMAMIIVGVIVFIMLSSLSVYAYKRFFRRNTPSTVNWPTEYHDGRIEPRLISPYITTTYRDNDWDSSSQRLPSSLFASLSTCSSNISPPNTEASGNYSPHTDVCTLSELNEDDVFVDKSNAHGERTV